MTTEDAERHGRHEGARLARSAGLVGALTLLSRVFGLLRDALVASRFRKRGTDVFFVAYTIPNVLRQLLAEGALTVAFVPIFTERRRRDGEASARAFYSKALGAGMLAWVLVCGLGIAGAPLLVRLFAYGFSDDPGKVALGIELTRMMFPYLLFVGFVALAMGALNCYGHYAAPAAAPAVLNLGIMATILLGTSQVVRLGLPAIAAVAIGVLVGGTGQVGLQLRPLVRFGLLRWPQLDLRDADIRRMGRRMLPSIFGLAIYQVNIILSRQFASFLEEGAISYIYYAQRLIEFPLGIFAVAVATVSLPSFATYVADGATEQLKRAYRQSLGLVLFVLLPATAGLLSLALPVIAVIYQRGAFSHLMAQRTALTMMAFALGICSAGGVRQTVPLFYALGDTRTPVKVSLVALLVYAVTATLIYRPLGTVGLALAVAASSTANFLVLLALLRRRLGLLGIRQLAGSAAQSAAMAAVAGGLAWLVARLGDWEQGGGCWSNYLVLLGAVVVGMMAYGLGCALIGSPELKHVLDALRRRRR